MERPRGLVIPVPTTVPLASDKDPILAVNRYVAVVSTVCLPDRATVVATIAFKAADDEHPATIQLNLLISMKISNRRRHYLTPFLKTYSTAEWVMKYTRSLWSLPR
jgi:hypothetical protein